MPPLAIRFRFACRAAGRFASLEAARNSKSTQRCRCRARRWAGPGRISRSWTSVWTRRDEDPVRICNCLLRPAAERRRRQRANESETRSTDRSSSDSGRHSCVSSLDTFQVGGVPSLAAAACKHRCVRSVQDRAGAKQQQLTTGCWSWSVWMALSSRVRAVRIVYAMPGSQGGHGLSAKLPQSPSAERAL